MTTVESDKIILEFQYNYQRHTFPEMNTRSTTLNGQSQWDNLRNWEHRIYKRETNKTDTQYVLDTTMRKQIQIT